MKKINAFVLLLVSAFFIFSCKINFNEFGLDTNTDSGLLNIPEGKTLVTVNFSLFNSFSKIAGIPDFSSLDIDKYVLTAKADGQTTKTVDLTAGATAANILLVNDIEWTIIIEGKNASGKTVVKGENTFTPTAVNNSLTVKISPYQQTSKDGTPIPGSIKLNIEFPQEDCTLKVDWYIDETLQGTVNADVRTENVTKVFEASSVEPGIHRITLKIVNSKQSSEVINKVYDLVVYSNMESKLWHNNSTPQEKITLTTDDIIPVTLEDYAFYVLGDSATNLTGTYESVAQKVGKKRAIKFDTIQEAVNAIEDADPDGKYKSCIYIDGMVMSNAPSGASEIVRIGNGINTPHIFIKGYNNTAAIFNLDYATENTRIITVNSNANVEIEGVTLMNGNFSENGGGIYCKGKLTFSGGITNCSAKYGGGLYCESGDIDFKGEISSCTVNNSGGGIYIKSGTVKVHDFEINQNSASNSAGGVYINGDSSVKAIFEDGKFSKNIAKKGTGGAITCAAPLGSDNGDYIYNACCKNVQFIENKAEGNSTNEGQGGAIFVYAGKYLALIDCSTEGNTAEQIGYGTEKYNGIYNTGIIYFGNTVDIQDGLHVNSAVRLASNVIPADGKNVIATIYPSSYTEGKEVLKAYSGSLTSDMISYFQLSNPNWKIDTNGKLNQLPAASGDGTISFKNDTLQFSLDKTTVASISDTLSISLDITDSSGSIINYIPSTIGTVINNFTIKVFCGGTEVTSDNISGFKIENGVITIPDTMPDDDYTITINGKYISNGQGISANLYFKVQR